jgi:hypothetical protein
MDAKPKSAERPRTSPAVERLMEEEVLDWCMLSPQERWAESMRLWETFYLLGGRLEPEPDPQSPFYDAGARGGVSPDGRPGMRVLRRGGV